MKKYLLFLIIVLAFILRFWRLDTYPALNADEAAIGYNAYSLIQTGLDEHGNPWPIHFQSFNDYKPGAYFYMVLPFVKILGLTEWAVRIPNAALGVATVGLVYLVVRELFAKQKNLHLGLIAAFLLAISPWHIHFSRGGWEVNTATFFTLLGVWLFVKTLNTTFSLKYLILSAGAFALSLYTYHAARIVVPLLGLGLTIIYWQTVRTNLKKLAVTLIIGFVLLLPLALDLVKPEISSRAAGVGLLADPGPLARINEQRGEHGDYLATLPKILHNKAVNYSLAFFENWFDHFHGEFLFLSGDVIERDKVPETGQMYLFDILFLGVGLIIILKGIKTNTGFQVIMLWLLVAPTAAALTFQAPHALRAENMVIPLIIISAFGASYLIDWGKKNIRNQSLLTSYFLLLTTLILWQFARYEHMYWVHMAKEYPFSSQYGVKELVDSIAEKESSYDKVIITDRYDQPYILFLFYMKYPPSKFQPEHQLTPKDKYGFSTVRNFGKYYFEPIDYDIIQPQNPHSLIVGTDSEIPAEANIIKTIYGTNGYKYFKIVAN